MSPAAEPPAPVLLDDAALRRRLPDVRCIAVAREWLATSGQAAWRRREACQVGGLEFVFSSPAADGRMAGFRCYPRHLSGGRHADVTTLYDGAGTLRGVHVGRALSAMRNASATALAAEALLAYRPLEVLVFGGGQQALAQVRFLHAARPLGRVGFVTRSAASALRAAQACARDTGIDARPATDLAQAAARADVVVCATSEGRDLLQAAALASRVLVVALGPKTVGASELSAAFHAGMDELVTDNPAQLEADWPALEASRSGRPASGVRPLARLLQDGRAAARTLLLMRGLNGLETRLLAEAVRCGERAGQGMEAVAA